MASFCRWKVNVLTGALRKFYCAKAVLWLFKKLSGCDDSINIHTILIQNSGHCISLHSYSASFNTHRQTVRRFQYHWHWHLPLKIQFCQVKNLFSHNPLFFHAPYAVESKANRIIPNHLRLDVIKFECLCEDRARSPLDAGFCSLLLYREKN